MAGDSGSFTESSVLVSVTPGGSGAPTVTDVTGRVKQVAGELDVPASGLMNSITETGGTVLTSPGDGSDPQSFVVSNSGADAQGLSGITTVIDDDPQYAQTVKDIEDRANFDALDASATVAAVTQFYERVVQTDPGTKFSDMPAWMDATGGTGVQQQAMSAVLSALPAENDPKVNIAEIMAQKQFINGPDDTTTQVTAQQQVIAEQTLEDNEDDYVDKGVDDGMDIIGE